MLPAEDHVPLTVSAIIVNWNGAALLSECLGSLQLQTGLEETMVVDNGSNDGSRGVAQEFGVRWIPLPTNTGLANAYNVGAKAASGDVLLFLNNDLALPPNFVRQIGEELRSPELGALDVHHVDWDSTQSTHERVTFQPRRLQPLDDSAFVEEDATQRSSCAFASGACFAIRADEFRRVGGWDAGFFAGWEDVDLSWRLRIAGLAVEYEPSLQIRHHVSASSDHADGQRARTYAAMTGRPRFAIKHAPIEIAILSIARLLVGTIRDLSSADHLRLRIKAIGVTVRDLPGLVRWRLRTYHEAQKTIREVWRDVHEQSPR